MTTKQYSWLFYFITITIVATISVQFYWNYKNYETNKQRVSNEIQLSFDNAIEEYYASLARSNYVTIVTSNQISLKNKEAKIDSAKKRKSNFSIKNIKFSTTDSMSQSQIDSIMASARNLVEKTMFKKDSSIGVTQFLDDKNGVHISKDGKAEKITYFKGKKAADSLKLVNNLQPIFISFLEEKINYNKVDSLIYSQLKNKGIEVKTNFIHIKHDTIFYKAKDSLPAKIVLTADSKSTYVKKNEKFKLNYTTPNLEALKRSTSGILLSLLLSLLIISCLFYLLKIIKQQKELSVIKNDLISNITHEFKTPIATVSTAIEAIENFNVINDKEKTQKYLSLSSIQLKKLHQMVEKLLETATLDSEQLLLKKETLDITEVIQKIVSKHQLLAKEKTINFSTNIKPIYVNVDAFHFENVVSNLIDNAIKYGGNNIEVNINSILNNLEITIADDGNGIEKNQQEKIFEKFYRVPKGNTHDVKGFGIGLYYCKKIINKHEGEIQLTSNKNQTIFKINIPNE